MTLILGPLPCAKCGAIVFVDRVGTQTRVLEKHGRIARKHGCRPKFYRTAKNRAAIRAGHA